MRPAVLSFEVVEREGLLSLEPHVGHPRPREGAGPAQASRPLLPLGFIGLDPDDLLPPKGLGLLPTRHARTVLIGMHEHCRDLGCGALALSVERRDDTVAWLPVPGARETVDDELSFDLLQYLDALDVAPGDRWWSSRSRRIALRVHELIRLDEARYGGLLRLEVWMPHQGPDAVSVAVDGRPLAFPLTDLDPDDGRAAADVYRQSQVRACQAGAGEPL